MNNDINNVEVTPWDSTDEDLTRAYQASARRAREIVPPEMLPYIDRDHFVDARTALYDAYIVGVDFSRGSRSQRRDDPMLRGALTLRLVGPYCDRRMAIRFTGVLAYRAARADHLRLDDIYWLEFLPADIDPEDLSHVSQPTHDPAHLCRIHLLSFRDRHDIVFRKIKFGVFPNEDGTNDDFVLPHDW